MLRARSQLRRQAKELQAAQRALAEWDQRFAAQQLALEVLQTECASFQVGMHRIPGHPRGEHLGQRVLRNEIHAEHRLPNESNPTNRAVCSYQAA
jgi:hypothetical protein